MAKTSRGSKASAPKHDSKAVRTCGEIFSDGSIIELVKSAPDHHLELLLWRKHQKTIAPRIEYRGRVYQAPDADETLLQAIRFPSHALDYGTGQKLFTEVCGLFTRYIGLAAPEAALLMAWSLSTWFPECFSSPPILITSGPDMGHAISLFRLLGCLCRRSLMLADINRSGLLGVVGLHPTLLVNQPGQFPKLWHLFGTTNFHGVYVPGSQGRVYNLAGSRAFFVGMEKNTWSDGAVHLALPPARPELLTLDAQRQAEIAKQFQPQLLLFRLRNLSKVHQSCSTVHQMKSPNSETVHNLSVCIQEDPDIEQAIAPLLQRQDQDAHVQGGCDAGWLSK